MISETLRLQNGFVGSRPASKRLLLQDRIRINKSTTFGYKKTHDGRCDVRSGKLSRNASLSLSLSFYFNQSLSFSLSFFSFFVSFSPFSSLSPFLFFAVQIQHDIWEAFIRPQYPGHIVSPATLSAVDQINLDRDALLDPFPSSWDVRVNIMPREVILLTV